MINIFLHYVLNTLGRKLFEFYLRRVCYTEKRNQQLSEFSQLVFFVDPIVFEPPNQNSLASLHCLIDYKVVKWWLFEEEVVDDFQC